MIELDPLAKDGNVNDQIHEPLMKNCLESIILRGSELPRHIWDDIMKQLLGQGETMDQ